MSAAEQRWDGRPVQIVQNGAVQTVTYRHAVSLVSRGLATWAPVEAPAKAPSKREKAPQKAGKTTDAAEVPVMVAVPSEQIDKFRLVSEQGPEIVNLPEGSIVSNPATGVEVDQAGYEPPLPDL